MVTQGTLLLGQNKSMGFLSRLLVWLISDAHSDGMGAESRGMSAVVSLQPSQGNTAARGSRDPGFLWSSGSAAGTAAFHPSGVLCLRLPGL